MKTKNHYEFVRSQARQRFDKVRGTWLDCGRWAAPHRIKWMLSQTEGERNNQHIVDPTHILSLRSYVAGFMEGNTSVSRPWYRVGTGDAELDMFPAHHEWLDKYVASTLRTFSRSNFYHAAGGFYYDYGVFNTGGHYIEEREEDNSLFFHTLTPGSYYCLNNGYGEAVVLVREFSLTVKALVDTYGRDRDGMADWSNISSNTRKMYEESNYTQLVDVVQVIEENEDFDINQPIGGDNRRWVSVTYELGAMGGEYLQSVATGITSSPDPRDKDKFLKKSFHKIKPFIVGKSDSSSNFEYGERGPTLDALGLIKSLNKKAISKDQAIEQILKPALQGPANLKKNYITSSPNSFIPLDAMSANQKGLRTIYEVNPAIGALVGDVEDMRRQVDRLYYADYLLYLSRNPKTRTATETNAVMQEQQMVIGPNLQSLNWTYNTPVVEFMMEWVLDNDPMLPEPPEGLAGNFIKPEFISIFAQAQRAADLPQVERYLAFVGNVGQLRPEIWDKVNLDRIADIYEDRLYLPAGINNDQQKVDAQREQAAMRQQRQQQLESMTQMAGAAKDVGIKVNPGGQ